MPFNYDPTTDRGKVRLLIGDTDTAVVANQFFQDAEVDAFLAMRSQSVLLSAAMACRAMAASEVIVQKRIRVLDLSTDGPAEAEALRKLAADYEAMEEAGDGTELPFDIAEMVYDDFSARERMGKQAQREAI